MNLKPIKRSGIIIGTGALGRKILNEITAKPELGLSVIGFVDDNIPRGTNILNGYKVLGKVENIFEICKENNVGEIIIAVEDIEHERLIKIINKVNETDCTVKLTSSIFEIISDKIVTESYVNVPTVTLNNGVYGKIFLVQKRIVDIAISIISLILLLPLFIVCALLIKLTSEGPILYKQERIGKNGKKFRMYKFRTMYVGADQDSNRIKWMKEFIKEGKHPKGDQKQRSMKIVDQSKITPVGKILRKFSIDELPQLINVLKGEMSLVGPRPVLPYEYEMFKPWYHERDKVLPGCTGFWQVYGRAKTSFDDMVLMDIYYIQNMSPWLDFQIILKTIPVILFGRGGG